MKRHQSEFDDNLEVARILLAAEEDSGDLLEANEFVNRALAIRPDDADAWILKARVLSELDDDFAALAAVEMALRQRPDLAEAHYLRAAVLGDLDRYEDALAAIDSAFARIGTSEGVDDEWLREDLYHEKALIEEAQGRRDQAAATFREGLAECPDSTTLKSLERERLRAKFTVIPGGRLP